MPGAGRMLGVDFGTKRVGVAVSDETATLARPLAVLPAVPRDRLLRGIGEIVGIYEPAAIVVGYPRRSRGEPGTHAAAAEAFAALLKEKLGVRVELRDEALTTEAAREKLLEAGARRRKRRERIDAAAAAVLLQAFLDERGRGT